MTSEEKVLEENGDKNHVGFVEQISLERMPSRNTIRSRRRSDTKKVKNNRYFDIFTSLNKHESFCSKEA